MLFILISVLLLPSGSASSDCPGGCIIASVPGPQRECKCVVPKCNWSTTFGVKNARRRKLKDGRTFKPKAADLGAPDCNFCERKALTYNSFAECYAAEAAFKPQGPSISTASYPNLISGRRRAVELSALVPPEVTLMQVAATASVEADAAPVFDTQLPLTAADVIISGEPAALMSAAPGATTAAAAVGGQSGQGSRRMLDAGSRSGPHRQLLQTCPTANPCMDTSAMQRWETLFAGTTAASDVTIPVGTPVVLHGCAQPNNTVTVRTITVPEGATLVIGDSALNLNLLKMTVSGTFQMGLPDCPIQSLMNVFIPGGNSTYGIIVMAGASYDVHAVTQGLTWTRISSTVLVGARSIPLTEPVQWNQGDKFVLTTTSWKDEIVNQNEVLTVSSVTSNGFTINTVEALQFNHYGQEYKAEVGLLTRRILFTSDATSTSTGLGPHTLMMTNNSRITGAGYERWGARNVAGHYSIHYHLAGNTTNAYVKNCAVYNSNWRCITIHGTNGVTLQGNVGFNVHGHCYYLENGVEERNVIDRNLAAYVHPIQVAGSGGGQQGTDRWQSATLFDPTDAGAGGFYSLNAYNTWTNNAASGGFAGFSFPHAPRPIKEHRYEKKANGFPFDPSQRPFILFKNNTVHSTGYAWEHGGGVYMGGMIFYKTDPTDSTAKLFYNNGRGSIQADPLCPDPNWPPNDGGNWNDCWINSARNTRNADDTADGFLIVQDTTVSLANVGVMSWGQRIEVWGLQGYDVTRGAEFLGQSWLTNATFRIYTDNTVNGWSNWPFSSTENYWESWAIKGFEWYDTTTTTILSNITFENYKYRQYVTDPNGWWYWQTPHAFRMLSHSDQFKPDKTMMVTKGIRCNNCDYGTCTNSTCTGGAFFRVDQTYRGSSWLFNWLDADGSVVRHVAPSKPAGPYLITSAPDWWQLDNVNSWKELKFGGEYGPIWVNPMPANEVAARLEMRVGTTGGQQYTVGAFDGQDITRIGYVSQFGDVSKQVVMTRTEGTTGMTGPYGWYTVWNNSATGYVAPKRVELVLFNVPRQKWVYWTSCWPAGTTFQVSKTFQWASCQNVTSMTLVNSRDALLRSGGNDYWVDSNNCLHLKLTDPGQTWQYTDSFVRDGLYIEEEVRWYDLNYTIQTNMACADTFFCTLPDDPASRVPPAIISQPPSCQDTQPAGDTCGSVKCGWSLWPGCSNTAVVSGGMCQASCGACPAAPAPSSPSPSPLPPSPSPKPPSPSPNPPSPSPNPPSPSPDPPSPSPNPPSPSPNPPSPSPNPNPNPPSPSPQPSPSPSPPILMKLALTNKKNSGYTCTATVTVTTTSGSNLSNVFVTVSWGSKVSSTVFPYSASGTTTSKGVVSFTSKTYPSTSPGGCTFTVVSATKTGYALDPATSLVGPTATW